MLFKELKINKIRLKNRIVVSPMCQYSAINGCPSEWHYEHLTKLANSGAGMLMIESTAVNKSGKIIHADLCLSNEKQEIKFKKLIKHINKISKIPLGIQISHSGRKGSAFVPWVKSNTSLNKKNRSWKTFAPSAIKRDKKWPIPKSLSKSQILKIIDDFIDTARRANRVGFECLEIHMAHGYLLHQFLSPVSNIRVDEFGKDLLGRLNLPLKIAKRIRKIWPKNKILGARITATDHLKEGINIKESTLLVKHLEKIGFDYVCVSSGGILPVTNMKFKKAFRANLSKKIKKKTSILIRTSGQIDDIQTANNLLMRKNVDFIAVARKFIKDPTWIYKASKLKNLRNYIPKPYLRCF